MNGIESFMSFAEITFPVLLLVPPLITSFRRFAVPPVELGRFFDLMMADYFAIVLVALYKAASVQGWLCFLLLAACAFLVTVALRYVMRWTAHEQLEMWIESGL